MDETTTMDIDTLRDEAVGDTVEVMRRSLRQAKGMTLIEVMIVLVILASVAGATSVYVLGKINETNIKEAQLDIGQIDSMVQQYYVVSSPRKLPDTLEALVQRGLTKSIPKDPWGNEYVYRKVDNRNFEIFSLGEDGQEGSDDDIRKAE